MNDIRLLSVDWDFFFPLIEQPSQCRFPGEWQLYDWGHHEGRALECYLWLIRAQSFFRNGLELPRLSGDEIEFWRRFDIRGAEVFVADSHSQIGAPEVLRDVREIVNFDAHHDSGYQEQPLDRMIREGTVLCDDWAVNAQTSAKDGVRVIYPRWRAHAMEDEIPTFAVNLTREVDQGQVMGRFDRVFVCRSGAWTPPWLDEAFARFVADTVMEHDALGMTALGVIPSRDWNEQLCREGVEIDERAAQWIKDNTPDRSNH